MMSIPNALESLARLLDDGRPHEALAELNALSTYRFTALYAFDGTMLRSVLMYDRENPGQQRGDDACVAVTYCAFVRDGVRPFELEDSLVDLRVQRHPKRFVVRSYLGVPVLGPHGACLGTLCCFDTTRVIAPPKLPQLLCEAAPLFRAVVSGGHVALGDGSNQAA